MKSQTRISRRNLKPPSKRSKPRSTAIIKKDEPLRLPEKVEQALIGGNLINLSTEERVSLVMETCKSLHLNPLTNPFIFILVSDWENDSERLILYASRNCTDQLRMIHGVTEVKPIEQWDEDGMLMARAYLQDRHGRCASDLGAIPTKRFSKKKNSWYELSGAQLANAKMHVGTKATRRATLKLVGLGGFVIDESELDTMKVIGGVTREGRIFRHEPTIDDGPKFGSHEAAQKVLQEKLSGARPLHTPEAPSPQEEAQRQPEAERPAASEPAPELTVRQVGQEFEISGERETMNLHRGLLLHYGRRSGQKVLMNGENYSAFDYQFCILRGGKLRLEK